MIKRFTVEIRGLMSILFGLTTHYKNRGYNLGRK